MKNRMMAGSLVTLGLLMIAHYAYTEPVEAPAPVEAKQASAQEQLDTITHGGVPADQGDVDIVNAKDADLFTDFDQVYQENLEKLFDEIKTDEDLEAKEMAPKQLTEETKEEVSDAPLLSADDTAASLVKE